jgi:hypothetical protein
MSTVLLHKPAIALKASSLSGAAILMLDTALLLLLLL